MISMFIRLLSSQLEADDLWTSHYDIQTLK